MNRREYLKLGSGVGAVALTAGCISQDQYEAIVSQFEDDLNGWQLPRANARNTAANRQTNLPAIDPSQAWGTAGSETGDGQTTLTPPTVVRDTLYVGSSSGKLYALGAASGTQQWNVDVGEPLAGAPAADGENVYVTTTEGTVAAYDLGSRTETWTRSTGNSFRSGPTVHSATVFAQSLDDGGDSNQFVYALDTYDGDLQWEIGPYSGPQISAPAVDSGLVFAATGMGLLALGESNDDNVRLYWHAPIPVVGHPVVENRVVYGVQGDGTVFGIRIEERDTATDDTEWSGFSSETTTPSPGSNPDSPGEETTRHDYLWRTAVNAVDSPAASASRLFVPTADGTVVALDKATGSVSWRFDGASGDPLSPSTSGAIVYVPTDAGTLYALNSFDGSVLSETDLPGAVTHPPAVSGSSIYAATTDGSSSDPRPRPGDADALTAITAEAAREELVQPIADRTQLLADTIDHKAQNRFGDADYAARAIERTMNAVENGEMNPERAINYLQRVHHVEEITHETILSLNDYSSNRLGTSDDELKRVDYFDLVHKPGERKPEELKALEGDPRSKPTHRQNLSFKVAYAGLGMLVELAMILAPMLKGSKYVDDLVTKGDDLFTNSTAQKLMNYGSTKLDPTRYVRSFAGDSNSFVDDVYAVIGTVVGTVSTAAKKGIDEAVSYLDDVDAPDWLGPYLDEFKESYAAGARSKALGGTLMTIGAIEELIEDLLEFVTEPIANEFMNGLEGGNLLSGRSLTAIHDEVTSEGYFRRVQSQGVPGSPDETQTARTRGQKLVHAEANDIDEKYTWMGEQTNSFVRNVAKGMRNAEQKRDDEQGLFESIGDWFEDGVAAIVDFFDFLWDVFVAIAGVLVKAAEFGFGIAALRHLLSAHDVATTHTFRAEPDQIP